MKLLVLRISGFRSYKSSQTFNLPLKDGLYFLCGKNQSEPRLEANGAGKSTVWEALCWVLYGKTSRGLKAGDVANWEMQDNTSVALDYEVGGLIYTVKRTWNPNSWTLLTWADETITLDANDPGNILYGHLKLTYSMFLHCCLMAQGQPMFLDLKAPDKAALFSEVMDLDKWIGYSSNSIELANKQDLVIRCLEKELSSLQGRLISYKEEDFSIQIEQWENNREKEIVEKEEQHKDLVAELKNLETSFKEANRNIDKLKVMIEDEEKEVHKLSSRRDELHERHGEIVTEITKNETKLEALEDQVEWFEKNDNCTMCLQKIAHSHKNSQRLQIFDLIDSLEAELKTLQDKLVKVTSKIDETDELIDEINKSKNEYRDKKHQEEKNASSTSHSINSVTKELARLENHVEDLLTQDNPFKARQNEIKNKKDDLSFKINQVQYEIDESSYKQRLYQYWIKGFKDLRLFLIAETLQQLEIEVNSCLSKLGLVEWQLQFDIDKENKGGSINRGFNVKVLSPHNIKPVPWEGWSGGESQRLRIAAEMGLANLIRSTIGATINLEVWDEATQFLSKQGIDDLLESLCSRSSDEKRQIWIIDHRTLGYGKFTEVREVTKTDNGTIIKL